MNLQHKKLLILDMNSTFMFGEDRFSEDEDYSIYYKSIGVKLKKQSINKIITEVYKYLEIRYLDENYRECFPSIKEALQSVVKIENQDEIEKIIDTFAFCERGYIPQEYLESIKSLSNIFTLAAVIDIWAPSTTWRELFKELGIYNLFSSISFSSDCKIVKPSAIPFNRILKELSIEPKEALVIGDSIRRDLGSAQLAGIECVIVAKESTTQAVACFKNLLEFEKAISFQ